MPPRSLALLLTAFTALTGGSSSTTASGSALPPVQDELTEVAEHHPGGELWRRYRVDESGRKQGLFEQFYVSGELELQARYRDDVQLGKYEELYETGAKRVVGRLRDGERHGAWNEYYPDGQRRLRAAYRKGQLHGSYDSYHPSGDRVLSTRYRDGLLDGDWEKISEDGIWRHTAEYDRGQLDGLVTLSRSREVRSRQRWRQGEIVELNGIDPYPVAKRELETELKRLLAPLGEAEKPADPVVADRLLALRRLQAYRCLVRVPYRDLHVDEGLSAFCVAAAEVCFLNGGLSHDPPRPAGLDEERYRFGHEGAASSNLFGGGDSLADSIDAYMDDSDPSNLKALGHRRWCLNPLMRAVGLGRFQDYSAMWVFDKSEPPDPEREAVLYPPPGYLPVDLFGARHAWSISLWKDPPQGQPRVRMTALDEQYFEIGEPLELDHLGLDQSGYGLSPCLVFRPAALDLTPGSRYWVEVAFGEAPPRFQYLVELIPAVGDTTD